MKKLFTILLALCLLSWNAVAQTIVHIDDPDTWTSRTMSDYVGQTVKFDVPFYICNNYYYHSGKYTIAPRRIFSPTNQAIPSTLEYTNIVTANSNAEITLTGLYDYHRMGEKLTDFSVYINSATSWTLVDDATFVGNTRTELNNGFPSVDIRGTHTLLVCAFNLEYYLVETIGQGFGPSTTEESQRQHTKIMDALTRINADIYGFVEIEQGQTALAKLANSFLLQPDITTPTLMTAPVHLEHGLNQAMSIVPTRSHPTGISMTIISEYKTAKNSSLLQKTPTEKGSSSLLTTSKQSQAQDLARTQIKATDKEPTTLLG